MGTIRRPRRGSLAVWPRVRARRETPRVRTWARGAREGAKLLGFAGYKAGMTTAFVIDNKQTSMTKDERIPLPVTVVECPPMRAVSIRFYGLLSTLQPRTNTKRPSAAGVHGAASSSGVRVLSEVFVGTDAALARTLPKHKKMSVEQSMAALKKAKESISGAHYLTILLQTQPGLTGIGKKKPELMEVALSGSLDEQAAFAEGVLGKDISITDVLEAGMQVDAKAVTKGKGFQGTTKRFGTKIRPRKTEKARRGAANVGPWHPAKVRYYAPMPGKMGYHNRTDYNKQILSVGMDPVEVNPDGGFLHYGVVKNPFLVIRGSVPGPTKRLIRLNIAVRPNKLIPAEKPDVRNISTTSKQGN